MGHPPLPPLGLGEPPWCPPHFPTGIPTAAPPRRPSVRANPGEVAGEEGTRHTSRGPLQEVCGGVKPSPSPPESEGEAAFLPAVAAELLGQVPQGAPSLLSPGRQRCGTLLPARLPPRAPTPRARAPQLPGDAEQGAQLLASPPLRIWPPARTGGLVQLFSAAGLERGSLRRVPGLLRLSGREAGPQGQQEEAGQRGGCSHLGEAQRGRDAVKNAASSGPVAAEGLRMGGTRSPTRSGCPRPDTEQPSPKSAAAPARKTPPAPPSLLGGRSAPPSPPNPAPLGGSGPVPPNCSPAAPALGAGPVAATASCCSPRHRGEGLSAFTSALLGSKCAAPTRGAPIMQGKVLATPLLYGAGGALQAAGWAEQRRGDLQGSSAAPSSCCKNSERGSGIFLCFLSFLFYFFLAGDVALKVTAGDGGWGPCPFCAARGGRGCSALLPQTPLNPNPAPHPALLSFGVLHGLTRTLPLLWALLE